VTLLSTGGGEQSLIYKERILSKYERDLFTKKKFYHKYIVVAAAHY
jgi:hypothetical protein